MKIVLLDELLKYFERDNCEYLDPIIFPKLLNRVDELMASDLHFAKFFFSYISNYLSLKPESICFSDVAVEAFERLVLTHLPSFCSEKNINVSFLLYMLFVAQEISAARALDFGTTNEIFTYNFLKTVRGIKHISHRRTWKELLTLLKTLGSESSKILYFSDRNLATTGKSGQVAGGGTGKFGSSVSGIDMASQMVLRTDFGRSGFTVSNLDETIMKGNDRFNKRKLVSPRDRLKILMHIGFYILQQPLKIILDNFVYVNDKVTKLPTTHLIHLSQFMKDEALFMYSTNTRATTGPWGAYPFSKANKLAQVLGWAAEYLDLKDPRAVSTMRLLQYRVSKAIQQKFLEHILLEREQMPMRVRVRVYQQLISLQTSSYYDSIQKNKGRVFFTGKTENTAKTIVNDVKRTSFFKGNFADLEKLLSDVADLNPELNYHQGLNYIGAFLLQMTGNRNLSAEVLSFIMHQKMEKYFKGDFENINKLVFMGETLISRFCPEFDERVRESDSHHRYYLDPLLLTVFFCSLKSAQCFTFLLKTLDLFIVQGWVAFYKVSGPFFTR